MINLLLTLLFVILIVCHVQTQTYTSILTPPFGSLQEQQQTVDSPELIYISPPSRPRNRKTSRRRPKLVIEQYLKEVTPTTKTLFSETQTKHTLQNDRIITQEDPLYYGQKHTSVALPAIVVPREYLSYINVKSNDDYANVRISNRKTNPYLPTISRYEEIDPVRENGDSKVQFGGGNRRESSYQDVAVSHIIGYFNINHEGIVPKDRKVKK